MIYLDYSASTPVNDSVLKQFIETNTKIYANPNSSHELGVLASNIIDETTKKIQDVLGASNYEVIYTSGATEANNLAIIGYALANQSKGKHIISTPYEHSSVTTCLNYLAKLGFEIDILDEMDSGKVDLSELESLIREDTILVTIAAINSELGIQQDLKKINEVIMKHPNTLFHSDMTQAIGKTFLNVTDCDLVSFSGHKIYGLKGIGVLLRKQNINLTPVVHGGKSTSIFRGGTPPTPLIESIGNALFLAYDGLDKKIEYISNLYDLLTKELLPQIKGYNLNYEDGIKQIINVSFVGKEAHEIQKALSKRQIYISTQTACNSESSFSLSVKRLTGSDALAKSSVRISLSHLTTKQELIILAKAIKEFIDENN